MRILISADIEGVSGVCHPEQTRPGSREYERARCLMTGEVSAAAQGALDGGADEVWAVDGHGTYRNIVFEELHPEVRLISGKPRLMGMLAGLNEFGPWDGVFLIGCHGRAGSAGVLAHTINGAAFAEIRVNGKAVGEAFLNGSLAGEQGVPVLLISGDDRLGAEAADCLPETEAVTVKRALGHRAAAHLPIGAVRGLLRDAAARAVGRNIAPYMLKGLLRVEVSTVRPVQADLFAQMPGVHRAHPTCVSFQAENPTAVVRTLNCFSAMTASL